MAIDVFCRFLLDILLLIKAPVFVWFDATIIVYYYYPLNYVLQVRLFLKKNLNAPRPSEHPPVRGKKCQNV